MATLSTSKNPELRLMPQWYTGEGAAATERMQQDINLRSGSSELVSLSNVLQDRLTTELVLFCSITASTVWFPLTALLLAI